MNPPAWGRFPLSLFVLLAVVSVGAAGPDEALQRSEEVIDRIEEMECPGDEAQERLDRAEDRANDIQDRIRQGDRARRGRERAGADRRKDREKQRETRRTWKAFDRGNATPSPAGGKSPGPQSFPDPRVPLL